MQRTRLWFQETDREAASPTESAAMVKWADREHWGAVIPNPGGSLAVGVSVGFTLQNHASRGRKSRRAGRGDQRRS